MIQAGADGRDVSQNLESDASKRRRETWEKERWERRAMEHEQPLSLKNKRKDGMFCFCVVKGRAFLMIGTS
jgi:hypothetical protein